MRNAFRIFGQKISREELFWRLEELETMVMQKLMK
jgi:hypothetical protein